MLFGLSHWMFVMNYMTLAMRIKFSDSEKFENHTTWLNIMYYGLGALNVCIPILQAAFTVSNPTVSNWLWLAVDILWIITAVVMILALVIISRSLDPETRVAVNCKEMSIHILVFTIFAVCCFYVSIITLISGVNPSIKEAKRIIDTMTVNIVLDSLCGLILMYIFIKIYNVVKISAEKNAPEVLFDDTNLSFVEQPKVSLNK